jgi:arabinose-5-phosphate isomerase
MTRKSLGMTLILDSDNTLAGIFTDGDLRRALDRGLDARNAIIDDVMTAGGKVAHPEMLAAEALKIMQDFKINSLPVLNAEQKAVGALNMHDLLRAGVM